MAVLSCLIATVLLANAGSARQPTGSSSIDRRTATPIACMKLLPDGARVYISRRPVVGVWLDRMYVEEADRSCGIRVVYGSHTPPPGLQRGNLVSLEGQIGTLENECVVYALSDIVCDDYEEVGAVGPLAMSTSGILGWPVPPRTETSPRVTGLLPIGVYVRVWGRVTASGMADDQGYYIYLDDGWNLKDTSGLGVPGIRVYSNARPSVGTFLIATGVLTNRIVNDPTPGETNGDEIIVPVIQAGYDEDPYLIPVSGVGLLPQTCGAVTGRVRLVGQGPPGESVRIYCQDGSVTLNGITNEFTPYALAGVSDQGGPVAASAPGYISNTKIAQCGDTGVDFELVPAEKCIEISTDLASIPICSSTTAVISAMLRDTEGKPFHEYGLKLTTTRGIFAQSGTKELLVLTDEQGQVQANLSTGSDGPGTANVVASTYPDLAVSSGVSVLFRGPDVTVSASPVYLVAPGTSNISGELTNNGTPVSGANLTFATDHGVFLESGTSTYQAMTNGDGAAEATLRLDSPGTAAVKASYVDSCSHNASNWAAVTFSTAPWYPTSLLGSSPLVVDLDGQDSGKKEIVILAGSGDLLALSSTGSLLWSRVTYGPGTNTASCVTVDAGISARPCVFVPSDSQQKVFGFSHDGMTLAGWPAGTNFRFLTVAAPIGDLNRDGSPEIVCGDECCYVFSWNPTGDWKKSGTWESSFLWHNITALPSVTISNSTCALGDLDNDAGGILDVAVGSNHSKPLFAFPGDLWGEFAYDPVYLSGYPKEIEKQVMSSPAIGDIDGDGLNDLAVGCDDEKLYMLLSGDGSFTGYATGGMVRSSPALYDLDGDSKLDVIVGSDSGRLFAFNWKGEHVEGWSGGIRLNSSAVYPIQSSPVIGDVNGDGQTEIVVGCDDGNIYSIYRDGTDHVVNGTPTGAIAWIRSCVPPGVASAKVTSTPAIDDVDADGHVDVVAASSEGVYIFHFDAPYTESETLFPWPTFHRDNQRTGCVTAPPAPTFASIQGCVRKNGAAVTDAQVYITYNDGAPVYEPHSSPAVERSYVLTVGTTDASEARRGTFCINQLPANSTYKLTIKASGEPDKVVSDIAVTTGLTRVDVDL